MVNRQIMWQTKEIVNIALNIAMSSIVNNKKNLKEWFLKMKVTATSVTTMQTLQVIEWTMWQNIENTKQGQKENCNKCNFETKTDGKQTDHVTNHESPCNKCNKDANTADSPKHLMSTHRCHKTSCNKDKMKIVTNVTLKQIPMVNRRTMWQTKETLNVPATSVTMMLTLQVIQRTMCQHIDIIKLPESWVNKAFVGLRSCDN